MILAITNENDKLISDICKSLEYDELQVINGIKSLNRFAIQELKTLNNFKYIIIDINTTNESQEEIIKAIVAIKSMYNIRIIIMALGYKENNMLLSKLFAEGIYNFVVGTDYNIQREEMELCLLGDGNQYKDAIRFRADIIVNNNDRVIIKKEYKKLKNFLTISIVGTESHIGATTQALLICSFFKNINMKACYISANEKNDIEYFEEMGAIKSKDNEMLIYNGIDMYKTPTSIDAMNFGYDCYIYDYGVFNENKLDNFISKDVKIVVSGTKLWEFEGLSNIFKYLEKLKDINFLFNFTEKRFQNVWTKNMKKFSKSIYYTEYTPNAFDINVNVDIYNSIFKDNIIEKSNKIEIIEKRNKNIFSIFRRNT